MSLYTLRRFGGQEGGGSHVEYEYPHFEGAKTSTRLTTKSGRRKPKMGERRNLAFSIPSSIKQLSYFDRSPSRALEKKGKKKVSIKKREKRKKFIFVKKFDDAIFFGRMNEDIFLLPNMRKLFCLCKNRILHSSCITL